MRVRLAFAVAAHLEPELLILDEVLAVGDAKFQEKCLNRIDEIKNSGVTILFVSHSAQSVLKLCSKGILLEEGRLTALGTAKEVTNRYLESMHLKVSDDVEFGTPESRSGIFAGKLAEYFYKTLANGSLAFNVPIETHNGLRIADLGWISDVRKQTIRTEPSWSAAPDIVVNFIGRNLAEAEAHETRHLLIRSGARESWVVWPNGKVRRYVEVSSKPLLEKIPDYLSLD